MGALKELATRKFGMKSRLIEMIATHHLGPKRSIHVLRIGEKTLVIGVTNESINLISELDSEEGLLNEYGAPLASVASQSVARPAQASRGQTEPSIPASNPTSFSDVLGQSGGLGRPMNSALSSALSNEIAGDGIRHRIKNRLEGYKQL